MVQDEVVPSFIIKSTNFSITLLSIGCLQGAFYTQIKDDKTTATDLCHNVFDLNMNIVLKWNQI